MLHRLAKTKTRIKHNALPGNAVLQGTVEALSEETVDVIQHVPVRRRLLHRLRCALHMHKRHRRTAPGNQGGHLRIEAHGTDIVYQHGARIQGSGRDAGTVRIDGYERPVALYDLPNDWYSPFLLHLGGDRHGSRTGRLATHVDNISPSG